MEPNPEIINLQEIMDYYGTHGRLGEWKLKAHLLRSWALQQLAGMSPTSQWSVRLHRARGVRIGQFVFLGPGVEIDLLYPHLVTIEDYASIGMHTMIFAHSNPTNSIVLKRKYFPRKVAGVTIRKGAWIAPGCIILCGVTIGRHSVVGAGSLVTKDVEEYSVVTGSPAKKIRDLA